MEQEYLADQAAIQKEMKQIQADIDAIYAANAGNGSQVDYSTTGFIYPVKGFQRICDVIFLQGYPCFLKLADIPGCCFLRKHYFILPVQPHKIILSLSEDSKQSL